MSDVTHILSAIEQGDPQAAEQLLPLVYEGLRSRGAETLARAQPGQTLPPPALVHEAYVRVVNGEGARRAHSRGPFSAAAAEPMRRTLVEQPRRRRRLRH